MCYLYFITNSYDAFAVEGENWADVVFYQENENQKAQAIIGIEKDNLIAQKPVAIGEAKSHSSIDCWEIEKLFYVKKGMRGAITQLWRSSRNESKIRPIFFTNAPIKSDLLHKKQLSITETTLRNVIDEIKNKNEKQFNIDFPKIAGKIKPSTSSEITKIAEFINRIEYKPFRKEKLFDEIISFLDNKFRFTAKPQLEHFLHYLNTIYEMKRRIDRNELMARLGLVHNPNILNYINALQTVVKKKLSQNSFALILGRKISPVKQKNKEGRFEAESGRSYTVADLVNTNFEINKRKPLAIMGGMGIGKSTFVLQILKEQLKNLDVDFSKVKTHESYYALPLFVQLRGLEENEWKEEALKNFSRYIRKYIREQLNQRGKEIEQAIQTSGTIERITKRFIMDEEGMVQTIMELLKIPTLVILDGLDEFKGDKARLFSLVQDLTANNHQVIITGRVHAFETIDKDEDSFYSEDISSLALIYQVPENEKIPPYIPAKNSSDLETKSRGSSFIKYKLADLTKKQVVLFVQNAKNILKKELPTYSSIKNMAPETENFPELNFRNPLVLQAILYSFNGKINKLSIYSILKAIAEYSFSWYITHANSFRNKLMKEKAMHEAISTNMKTLLEIHQVVATDILLQNNQNFEKKATERSQSDVKYNEQIESYFLESKNVGFIQVSYEGTDEELNDEFYITPDRMFDFFVVRQIKSLLKTNKIKNVISLLQKIMGNTDIYQNLTKLFVEVFIEELEGVNCLFPKIENIFKVNRWESERKDDDTAEVFFYYNKTTQSKDNVSKNISKKRLSRLLAVITLLNNDLKLLCSLGFDWYTNVMLTKDNVVVMLDLSNLKDKFKEEKISTNKFFQKNVFLNDLNFTSLVLPALRKILSKLSILKHLKILNFQGNQIKELPPEIERFTQLTTLILHNNQLTKLPAKITELKQLTALGLNNNRLGELQKEITELKQLTVLGLNDNQLEIIPSEIAKLKKLTLLTLDDNRLTDLPKEFKELTQLTTLTLHSNQLTELPCKILELAQLKALGVNNNQLENLPSKIEKLTKLTNLVLQDNQLKSLPPEIGKLKQLTTLRLSNNQLTELPKEFTELIQLTILTLENNQLESHSEIFELTQLTELGLRNTQLVKLPKDIGKLAQLSTLGLDNNQLKSLPPEIGKLTQLVGLGVNSNQLKNLPSKIGKLTQLTILGLYRNKLTKLPSKIGELVNLTTLDLRNNQLSILPENLKKLVNLKQLYLQNNKLTGFSSSFSNLSKIEELVLNNNSFKTVPGIISSLRNLKMLMVEDFPFEKKLNKIGHLTNLYSFINFVSEQRGIQELEVFKVVLMRLKDLDFFYFTIVSIDSKDVQFIYISDKVLLEIFPAFRRFLESLNEKNKGEIR